MARLLAATQNRPDREDAILHIRCRTTDEMITMEHPEFTYFPRTDFLFNDGGLPKLVVKRQLLTPDELDEVLSGPTIVEEKIDGSNTGMRFTEDGVLHFQGRTKYLGERTHSQAGVQEEARGRGRLVEV